MDITLSWYIQEGYPVTQYTQNVLNALEIGCDMIHSNIIINLKNEAYK